MKYAKFEILFAFFSLAQQQAGKFLSRLSLYLLKFDLGKISNAKQNCLVQ